jgi:uncharacterized phage protein gp47/JayE
MSLQTPTTQEIRDNIVAQLEASLNTTFALLPKAFVRVLAGVLAGVFILLYKYAGFIFLQLFVRHASTQETTIGTRTFIPLEEWGVLSGVGRRRAATSAEHIVQVAVDTQTGALPVGTQVVNQATQIVYTSVAAVPLDAPTVELHVRAVSDSAGGTGAGVIGNVEAGTVLQFVSPLKNVQRDVVVLSTVVQGADAESWELYRARVTDRFQAPPQGGAYADYRIWGSEVEGIANVYPYTSECPSQVEVYVEATVASSGSPDGIPTAAQLAAVSNSIELGPDGIASRRPANALVLVLPITRQSFDVEIVGLEAPDLSVTRAAITDALTTYFLAQEPYIPGLSVPPRNDRVTATAVGGVVADIVQSQGGVFVSLLVRQSGALIEAYALDIGEKAKLGIVSFV